MTFKTFEDVDAWKKARELARSIYGVTAKGAFARDFALRDQIRRASISVMSNVAEGHGRGGTKEFTQFLSMALGSANEVGSHLYVALDQKYLTDNDFRELTALAHETANLIGGLSRYLRTTALKGRKFDSGVLEPGTKNQQP
ncbi:four helix bundle protein [candidate division WOR-3 bacterium]|nr:four helix bundle protein [candidate division WOR-3 bacterium]